MIGSKYIKIIKNSGCFIQPSGSEVCDHGLGQIQPAVWFYKQSFIGTQAYPFFYALGLTAFQV